MIVMSCGSETRHVETRVMSDCDLRANSLFFSHPHFLFFSGWCLLSGCQSAFTVPPSNHSSPIPLGWSAQYPPSRQDYLISHLCPHRLLAWLPASSLLNSPILSSHHSLILLSHPLHSSFVHLLSSLIAGLKVCQHSLSWKGHFLHSLSHLCWKWHFVRYHHGSNFGAPSLWTPRTAFAAV